MRDGLWYAGIEGHWCSDWLWKVAIARWIGQRRFYYGEPRTELKI